MAEKTTREMLVDHCNHIAEDLQRQFDTQLDTIGFLREYFGDALDIEYTVDADLRYKAVRLMVTFGGPTIYVNTRSGLVEGYWWEANANAELSREVCDAIDDIWREFYECQRL